MSNKTLHIVSFDIPYPADYGGVIDVFYKIKSLHELGVEVILHCFQYNRDPSEELKKYCKEVFYYERKSEFSNISLVPYIVYSRRSDQLLANLQKDNHPILFEGLHDCYYLTHPSLKQRKKIVRLHNIEHDYYYRLYQSEKKFSKKLYFYIEYLRLKKFQKHLSHADALISISQKEFDYFSTLFNHVLLVPPFLPYTKTNIKEGKGTYVLYHGNLSVAENERAAFYIIEQVYQEGLPLPLVLAGKNPSIELVELCRNRGIPLVSDPGEKELIQLIQNAHINLLMSFQETGSKLKLYSALFNGRHCLVNKYMIDGNWIEPLVHLGENNKEIREAIIKLLDQDFSLEDIDTRSSALNKHMSNAESAKKII